MKKYLVDLGDDDFVTVPENIQYKIIQDHLTKSYHWVIGIGMFIIGFLFGKMFVHDWGKEFDLRNMF